MIIGGAEVITISTIPRMANQKCNLKMQPALSPVRSNDEAPPEASRLEIELKDFVSFDHVADPEERAGKEIIQHLELLRIRYPGYSRVLIGTIEEIQVEIAPRPASPRDRVLAALAHGENTVGEIRVWTRLSNRQVRKLLGELELLKRVRSWESDDKTHKRVYMLVGDLPSGVLP